MKALLEPLDHVEEDPRGLDGIVRATEAALWLRCANFFSRSLDVLRAQSRPRLVLWKLEFWGTDTPYEQFPTTPGVDPVAYAEELLGTGHRIVPYTYTEWNRQHIVDRIPALGRVGVHVLPVAQKPPVPVEPGAVRRRFGIPKDDTVFGVGGLLHPAKGVEEVVAGFLRSVDDTRTHLLCSVIPQEPGTTAEDLRGEWRRSYGGDAIGRVHVRVGDYGEWSWMCAFHEAVDVLLVNSISDSWGRMVSEAFGTGVPVLVRRTGCSTNHIAPGTVLVEGFGDFGSPAFTEAVHAARAVAPSLAAYVRLHYTPTRVRARLLALLRDRTPRALCRRFDELAGDPASLARLDHLITY